MQEEEGELFPAAEKALGARSETLCAKMAKLFGATAKAGYEQAVGRVGTVVGAGVSLLFAPTSGAELRTRISKSTRSAIAQVSELLLKFLKISRGKHR